MKLVAIISGVALIFVSASGVEGQSFSLGYEITSGVTDGTIVGSAGDTRSIDGFVTISSDEASLGGWSFAAVFQTPADNPVPFCIAAEVSSPYFTGQKNLLLQEQLIPLTDCDPSSFNPTQQCETTLAFPNTVFVIQDEGAPLAECVSGTTMAQVGDPSATVPGVDSNGGQRGILDASIMTVGPPGLPTFENLRILPFRLDIQIPAEASELVLTFSSDGLSGPGQGVSNTVSASTGTIDITDFRDEVIAVRPSTRGNRPGDIDGDGSVSAMDGVSMLRIIFEGDALPCDGGFSSDCNMAMLDLNGDNYTDMSDAIYGLMYSLLGGSPPAGGTDCQDLGALEPNCDA